MVIYLAALQGVPTSVYEASEIYGKQARPPLFLHNAAHGANTTNYLLTVPHDRRVRRVHPRYDDHRGRASRQHEQLMNYMCTTPRFPPTT